MVNAETARQWYTNKLGSDECIDRHLSVVTPNVKLAKEFGITEDNIFKMWNWVGCRYSLWSEIGLSIVIDSEKFDELLEVTYEVDQHFKHTPFEKNIPVMMALLGIQYSNFFVVKAMAVLPYEQYLNHFPGHLQQADMESNGKDVDRQGEAVGNTAAPVIFGVIGIAGQHASFSYYTREQNWSLLIFLLQFIVFATAPNIIAH